MDVSFELNTVAIQSHNLIEYKGIGLVSRDAHKVLCAVSIVYFTSCCFLRLAPIESARQTTWHKLDHIQNHNFVDSVTPLDPS